MSQKFGKSLPHEGIEQSPATGQGGAPTVATSGQARLAVGQTSDSSRASEAPSSTTAGPTGNSQPQSGTRIYYSIGTTQILKELEAVVDAYRLGKILKHKVLWDIFAIVSNAPRAKPGDRDTAIHSWTGEVDPVKKVLVAASEKGAASNLALPIQPPSSIIPLKRRRESSEDRESNRENDGDEHRDGDDENEKRGRIEESELPWYNRELTAKRTENPAISKNR